MFKQMIQNVQGADVYMVSSFLIFLLFFIGVTIWLFTTDKNELKQIGNIPINDNKKTGYEE